MLTNECRVDHELTAGAQGPNAALSGDDGAREGVSVQASAIFRLFERMLLNLHRVFGEIRAALLQLPDRLNEAAGQTDLVLSPKRRHPQIIPSEVYFAHRRTWRDRIGRTGKVEKPRVWLRHIGHTLRVGDVARIARNAAMDGVYRAVERRLRELSLARRNLVSARQSIEQTLINRGSPKRWEAGHLQLDPPLVSDLLPPSSARALGAGWRFSLRAASVVCELRALAERYKAAPAAPGLKLRFEQGSAYPYGRLVWTLGGVRLLKLARKMAKAPRRVKDPATLTDRVLRQIPELRPYRAAIRSHEAARRQMAKVHARYTQIIGALRKRTGQALALADRTLRGGCAGAGRPAVPNHAVVR